MTEKTPNLPQILPPLPDDGAAGASQSGAMTGELPPELEFTPVPRHSKRWDGINPLKQRHFIAQLAASGSVTMAAKCIGISSSALYQLRRGPGAESFAAAWEVAVDIGARRVLDVLIEHAIHGTPETLSKGGEMILERRRYNHRAMMWIVAHRFPEKFGGETGLMNMSGMSGAMKKLKDKWRAEWEEEQQAEQATLIEDESQATAEAIDQFMRLYAIKVEAERSYRLEGRIAIADFTMRQLTHMEMVLETNGVGYAAIRDTFDRSLNGYPGGEDGRPCWNGPLTASLAQHRHDAWARAESHLPRPPERLYRDGLPGEGVRGGKTHLQRHAARADAEQRIAEAQEEWEAAASEANWADWQARLPAP